MDEARRRRILEFVKPLAAGLDGVTTFGEVERAVAAARRIAGDRDDVDPDRLFLLAAFSGQERWSRQFGHGSRLELFLGSVGVSADEIRELRRALPRFERDPRSPEEEIVHDAVRLERIGAYGIARLVARGHREGMDFAEVADELEAEAARDLRTPAGRELAAPRRDLMREFARRLREEFEEFRVPPGPLV
jgi:enoyl-CoA hydratase/carnithine racemase